jgi:hypothetical protein
MLFKLSRSYPFFLQTVFDQ